MSRREYPVADYYEDRERDFYRNGRRGTRDYVEFDEDIRTARTPDFLRDGYGRSSNAGPLVVRAHKDDDRTEVDVETRSYAKSARGSPPRRREVEREEIIIRDNLERAPPPRRRDRSVPREEFSIRKSEPDLRSRRSRGDGDDIDIDIKHTDARSARSGRPREVERDEVDIDIRRREDDARSVRSSRRPRAVDDTDIDIDIRRNSDTRSVRSSRPREFERDEISIRRAETERVPPRSRTEEEEIMIRRGEGPRPAPPRPAPYPTESTEVDIDTRESERRGPRGRVTESDELDIDIKRSQSRGRGGSRERERITIREQSRGPPPRERSMPPPNLVRRDTEEFVIRRRRPPSPSPSPPPPPPVREEQIIIRRIERSPTPPPPPPPPPPEPELPPPPVLAPIIRPPIHQEIHQEIITHHRHIDHGIERARSPSPLPPPPPPPAPIEEKNETLEIDIRRERGGRTSEEEIDIRRTQTRDRSPSIASRARSVDASLSRRHDYYDDDISGEADYYNRKALERGYPGEAYNGATRDWGLVDVPPGTERVRMDGAGGGAQEITWQRYNGNRRSKFVTGGREYDTGYGEPSPVAVKPSRPSDMWTEVTKDLVLREAIEQLGYGFEETDTFFYIMEYLRYEDVVQLVEISDDIRRQRRRRIRELEWERSNAEHRSRDDDRYYEREVIIDKRERRY